MAADGAAVVILGGAGTARDQLSAALSEAGARVVLASHPSECTPDEVLALAPRNIVVLVEPELEESLERFDALFEAPGIEFLFEEASVLAARQGWDAARWSRHLASKLHLREHALPEGVGSDEGFVAPRPADALKPRGEDLSSSPAPASVAGERHAVPDAPVGKVAAPALSDLQDEAAAPVPLEALAHPGTPQPADSLAMDASSLNAIPALEPAAFDSPHSNAAPAASAMEDFQHGLPGDFPEPIAGRALEPDAFDNAPAAVASAPTAMEGLEFTAASAPAPTSTAQAPAALNFDDFSFDIRELERGPLQVAADIPDLLPELPDVQPGRVVAGSLRDHGESALLDGLKTLDDAPDVGPRVVVPTRLEELSDDQILAGIDFLETVPDAAPTASAPAPAEEPLPSLDWALDMPAAPAAPVVPLRSAADTGQPATPGAPALPDIGSWSLEEITPVSAPAAAGAPKQQTPRPSGLSLVDDGTAGLDFAAVAPAPAAATPQRAATGRDVVIVVAGVGGPDPLRTLLGQLPAGFPRAVLVQQRLDAGNYDRLARQMERAAPIPVRLAEPGMQVESGNVYILPGGLDVVVSDDGLAFNGQPGGYGFPDLTRSINMTGSALVILSGANPDVLDAVVRVKAAGGWVAAQAASGCFDHAVPALAVQRGAETEEPATLARRLGSRFNA